MPDLVVTFGNNTPHQINPAHPIAGANPTGTDPRTVPDYVAPNGEVIVPLIPLDPIVSNMTTVVFPEDASKERILADISALWGYHSADDPAWFTIEGGGDRKDIDAIITALREKFDLPAPDGPVALFTNAGKDMVAKQVAGAASATAVAKWVALTANATAPAAGDTTLTGEIVTAGGGLLRVATTYAHTNGTSTWTLTNTFTANGSDALPVTLAKVGCFDAASAGNMVFETLLSSTATLTTSGDNMPLTWTVTES